MSLSKIGRNFLKGGAKLVPGSDAPDDASLLTVLLERLPGDPTVTLGAETGGDTRIATVQMTDLFGDACACERVVKWWLSATAGGAPAASSGGVAVSTGNPLTEHVNNAYGEAVTDEDGVLGLTIIEASTTSLFLYVSVDGMGGLAVETEVEFA